MPKVSICVPAYNAAIYLPTTLQSILNQTFQNFEVIIADDCSTDNTQQIIQNFPDKRIRYFKNEKNLGWVANMNRCLKEAQGPYICILNADDGWRESFLKTMISVLDQNPKVGLIFSAYHIIDASGKELKLVEPYSQNRFFKGKDFFAADVLQNIVGSPTVMVRQECYRTAGLYDPQFLYMADWETWLRIALQYDVAYIAKPLAFWRLHPINLSSGLELGNRHFCEEWKILQKIFKQVLPDTRKWKPLFTQARLASAKRLYGCAQHHLAQGDMKLFRKQSALSIKMNPAIAWQHLILLKMGLSYLGITPFLFLRKLKARLLAPLSP